MAAFQGAVERSRYREMHVGEAEYDSESYDVDLGPPFAYEERRKKRTEAGLVDLVESTEAVWETVDSVLDSIKSVIPPAGVLAEIKEAVKAGVTMLKDRMHPVKFVKKKLNRLLPRKHKAEPAVVSSGEVAPA